MDNHNEPKIPNCLTFKAKLNLALVLSLLLWGLYFLENYTSVRITSRGNRTSPPLWIEIPSYGSLLLIAGSFFSWRTSLAAYRNSFAMDAEITKVGIRFQHYQQFHVRYMFGPKVYNRKIAVAEFEAGGFTVGSMLPVFVDARNPKRVSPDPHRFQVL